MKRIQVVFVSLFVFILSMPLWAQDGFKDIEKQVVELQLKNGFKFLILPRHNAPVVSFHTHVDVGSVNEDRGITGLAHIFEHLAFKGTSDIGTKDYKKEKTALDALDKAWKALRNEEQKGRRVDSAKLAGLRKEFEAKQDEASKWIENNEFGKAIEENGGVGLNASTSSEVTQYFYSLPSNKLELWFALESGRFYDPVFRDFYKEKNVIMEERRMRTESSPIGKLIEEFIATAYKAHPYRDPVVGHMSDLKAISKDDAIAFYKKYYVPSNIVIAVVGDVEPKEVQRLAEIYFGRIPASPKPEPVRTLEPPQNSERRVTLREQSQRWLLVGYKKGSVSDPDNAVYDAVTDLLSAGRTSRLYKSLVRDKKLAVQAAGFSGFPGQKYPNLFLFYALPSQGHTNEECLSIINDEIAKLKTELVSEEDLNAVKTRARADLIRSLSSNSGMAGQLTYNEVLMGDWHEMFNSLEKINAIKAEDVKRVANQVFTDNNRTIGTIEPIK
jgi:predicted Zn-dependent peptidase